MLSGSTVIHALITGTNECICNQFPVLQTDGYKGVSRWYCKVHVKCSKMVHVNAILQVNLMQQDVIFVLLTDKPIGHFW